LIASFFDVWKGRIIETVFVDSVYLIYL